MMLKKGDEIRIIAPSKSMKNLTASHVALAKKKIGKYGIYSYIWRKR